MAFERFFRIGQNCLEFNLNYLFYVGLWPREDFSRKHALLYTIYETVLHILSINYLVLTTIGTYQNKDNLDKFLSNLDKILVGYNFVLKVVIFILNRKQLMILIKEIKSSGDTVPENKKRWMIFHVILVTAGTLLVVGLFSLFALIKRQMVIEVWMPFDPLKNTLNYFLTFQITVNSFTIPILCRSMAMQGIVCSIAIYLCEQYTSLQTRIKELKYSTVTVTSTKNEFKEIIKKHIRLMRYSKLASTTFKGYFLIQNIAVSIELCFTAVVITMVGYTQMKLLSGFIAYLIMTLINAYIYCYLGNEMIIQSAGIAVAAYEASWTYWPLDMQKDLLLLITVAQRPLNLTAAGIVTLSMEAFSQILTNGYSVFAVLSDFVN